MLFSSLISILGLFAIVYASPISTPHVVHEKRWVLPLGWSRKDALHRGITIPMKVGLAQRNLDKGWEWLNSVSHPDSSKYGQHWTAEEVANAFAPSEETASAAKAWLSSAGISEDRVRHSQSLGFLEFEANIGEAEDLLKTKYHLYEHDSGQPHVACEEYSIPEHLRDHIDFISPTIHFDAKAQWTGDNTEDVLSVEKRQSGSGINKSPGKPNSGSLPKLGRVLKSKSEIIRNLTGCDEQTTPICLRALYQLPKNPKAAPNNSFGIVEYTPQAYVPSDLDIFFHNFSVHQIGNRPILDSIDGGIVQQTNMSFDFNGESNLDLEYAMTLVYPQNVTLYQAGDLVVGASFNNFLDAIDASYCKFRGGDSEKYDPTYPDPYPGGYSGPKNCGGFAATKVISTSYSNNEHDYSPFYERRQCYEYMKLGMMGVTVIYSSGDYGVEGTQGTCINGTGRSAPYISGTTGGRFNPSFPGTCPYVTTVGATQVIPNATVTQPMASGIQPEQACETKIYSGGGFSNLFALPDYQTTAVKTFFSKYPPPYGASVFNNSQMTRGIPDVSANGANYVVAYDGNYGLAYGTSAAAPTFASVISLINGQRLLHGKSSVGFINPVAYAHPEVFNDITDGSNPGCATNGFSASPGWDPVTGLGTPNYPKMLKLWLSLS